MKLPMHMPYNRKITTNAKQLRANLTEEEKKLWYQYLCSYPIRFTRQKIVDNYILDFYCSKCRLGIELDGSQHYTENGIGHDEARTKQLNAYGVAIIRFSDDRIMNDFFTVCSEIDMTAQGLLKKQK